MGKEFHTAGRSGIESAASLLFLEEKYKGILDAAELKNTASPLAF